MGLWRQILRLINSLIISIIAFLLILSGPSAHGTDKNAFDFTFPMLAGNRRDVLKAYQINYVPVLVFVDAKKIVNKVVGHYIHEPELHDNIREIILN